MQLSVSTFTPSIFISPFEPIHHPSFPVRFRNLVKDFHHDLARDIGQQVEVMILDAKLASETKVGKEVQKIKQKMEVLPRCFVWRFVPLIPCMQIVAS